jgi:hypothetical protein
MIFLEGEMNLILLSAIVLYFARSKGFWCIEMIYIGLDGDDVGRKLERYFIENGEFHLSELAIICQNP